MEHIENIRKVLGDFQFNEFRIVREFRFYEIVSETGFNQKIDLILDTENRKQNYRLKLSFGGVSGLKIENFGGGETRIIGFDIENISKSGWEGINWKVLDFENNSIIFFAKDISVISIIPST